MSADDSGDFEEPTAWNRLLYERAKQAPVPDGARRLREVVDPREVEPDPKDVAFYVAREKGLRLGRAIVDAEADASSPGWDPIDLADYRGRPARKPEIGWRSDGAGMFYRGTVNLVFGESESGKTWLALGAAANVLRDGGRVVYFDAEDGPHGMAQRFEALALEDEHWLRLDYVNPSTYSEAARNSWTERISAADLVVFDATTEFLALMGNLSSNSDVDVARFMGGLPKWAAALGPAVVVIDHTPKDSSNQNSPQGSQHKKAAVDGAMYFVQPVDPIDQSHDGSSKVWLNKDKQGGVSHLRVGSGDRKRFYGTMHGGPAGFALREPDAVSVVGKPKAEADAQKIFDAVAANPGITTKGLREATKLRGPAFANALERSLRGGVREEPGNRKGSRHFFPLQDEEAF